MEINMTLNLQDEDGMSHKKKPIKFNKETTIEQLEKTVESIFLIDEIYQELFFDEYQILDLRSTLEQIGIKNEDEIIVKHADLPWWTQYKKCVELVLKRCWDREEIANEAVRLNKRLNKRGFFKAYPKFDDFRQQFHYEVTFWADDDVSIIREAVELYFRNLHDQRKGNEDSEFICYFKERDPDLGGRIPNTLAFIQLHGEDAVKKYNIKCHHHSSKGISSDQVDDIVEFYCYKLLELIGVGPKSLIIPPITSSGIKTSTYIATQWDDNFELLENVIDKNTLCVDVVVQLVMLKVLLDISDLTEQNCGRWKGTKDAAIVDFILAKNYMIRSNVKSELITSSPNIEWRKEYFAVKNQYDDKSFLEIAKMYMDKWDFLNKIELARELIDPILLENLEIDFSKRRKPLSPTEELSEYIDTLKKNVENLQTQLNSII